MDLNSIRASVIKHSINRFDEKIATMELVYPRFIHAEAKTHRVISSGQDSYELFRDISFMDDRDLSRNAMSSRAVPVAKMIDQVRNDPAMPIHWGTNQPGMQAGVEIGPEAKADAIRLWRQLANTSADVAEAMSRDLSLHKQVVNRILEPFQWMRVIVTSTEWENFFALRCHELAEPNMQALAYVMRDALAKSTPTLRDMHHPYVEVTEYVGMNGVDDYAMVSAARCARVSYLNHDGTRPAVEKDLELANMLKSAGHASPFEHVAFAGRERGVKSRNFTGWHQYRAVIGL